MNFLNKKRGFITSKLKFKSKESIPSVVYKEKKRENEKEVLENEDIKSTIPFKEEDEGKKEFKEFISEKDLIRGLNPEKSYSKLSKIEPLPKEYKIYSKIKYTKFEKKHLKKIEKEKNKLSVSKKIEKWNFDSNYDKYQKLLTSLPEFNELPRISGV
jgi:hypothetical protein